MLNYVSWFWFRFIITIFILPWWLSFRPVGNLCCCAQRRGGNFSPSTVQTYQFSIFLAFSIRGRWKNTRRNATSTKHCTFSWGWEIWKREASKNRQSHVSASPQSAIRFLGIIFLGTARRSFWQKGAWSPLIIAFGKNLRVRGLIWVCWLGSPLNKRNLS